jgi:poly(3-hydroxyalkanoate) synthetase
MSDAYIHTHWQAAKASRTSQSLSKSMAVQTHRQRKSTGIQHCIRAIAGEVVKSRSVHLINFCGGGQVIALKSATALILDRYRQAWKNALKSQKRFSQ